MQTGGVKLKDPSLKGFEPVYRMMQEPDCEFDVLTYTSRNGFLFTMNVAPEKSEYTDLSKANPDRPRFTEPVTSLILKMSVITRPGVDVRLPECNGRYKESETAVNFHAEAKLQQTCWLRSISGARPAICPSIANLSFFNNRESNKLLDFLKKFRHGLKKDNLRFILDYLAGCCRTPANSLGVIVMTRVNDSIPFYGFMKSKPTDDDLKFAFAMVIAQIVRLFIQLNVMHFDLHGENALVSGGDKTKLIDFGSAADLRVSNTWVDDAERTTLLGYMNTQESSILSGGKRQSVKSAKDKQDQIFEILDKILELDERINKGRYGSQILGPQMGWIERYKDVGGVGVGGPEILTMAFDMLVPMMTVVGQGIQPSTITAYIREGSFVDLDKPIGYYAATLPVPVNPMNPFAEPAPQPTLTRLAAESSDQPRPTRARLEPAKNAAYDSKLLGIYGTPPQCDEETGAGCTMMGGRKRRKSRRRKRTRRK